MGAFVKNLKRSAALHSGREVKERFTVDVNVKSLYPTDPDQQTFTFLHFGPLSVHLSTTRSTHSTKEKKAVSTSDARQVECAWNQTLHWYPSFFKDARSKGDGNPQYLQKSCRLVIKESTTKGHKSVCEEVVVDLANYANKTEDVSLNVNLFGVGTAVLNFTISAKPAAVDGNGTPTSPISIAGLRQSVGRKISGAFTDGDGGGKGFFGLFLGEVDDTTLRVHNLPEKALEGAQVLKVAQNSSADKAGIQKYDIVLSSDGDTGKKLALPEAPPRTVGEMAEVLIMRPVSLHVGSKASEIDPGTLSLSILEGTTSDGSSFEEEFPNCYVVATIGNQRYKSKVAKASIIPEWNEIHKFSVWPPSFSENGAVDEDSELVVAVYQKRRVGKDRKFGEVTNVRWWEARALTKKFQICKEYTLEFPMNGTLRWDQNGRERWYTFDSLTEPSNEYRLKLQAQYTAPGVPHLGAKFRRLTNEEANRIQVSEPHNCVAITNVERKSPADECGLEAGDVVVTVGGKPAVDILTPNGQSANEEDFEVGHILRMLVYRDVIMEAGPHKGYSHLAVFNF